MKTLEIKITPFAKKVIDFIRAIPKGRVATYGQIARLAGKPQASRAVGWILNSCTQSYGLPWQRVLNSKGAISFHKNSSEYATQIRLLRAEGVHFENDRLDLSKYQWKKEPRLKKVPKVRGRPSMFS